MSRLWAALFVVLQQSPIPIPLAEVLLSLPLGQHLLAYFLSNGFGLEASGSTAKLAIQRPRRPLNTTGLFLLRGLTDLSLSNAGLSSVPPEISALLGLKALRLSGNAFKGGPGLGAACPAARLCAGCGGYSASPIACPGCDGLMAIAALGSSLETLDIGQCGLEAIPAGLLPRLPYLVTLNLMANRLVSLPDDFGGLAALQTLGLKSNRLSSLPPSIGGLASLTSLFVSNNELQSLPESLSGCAALRKLQASHNRLVSLPECLGALPQLEMVRAAANCLPALPPCLARSPRLCWLALAGNPFCPPAPPPSPPGTPHDSPTPPRRPSGGGPASGGAIAPQALQSALATLPESSTTVAVDATPPPGMGSRPRGGGVTVPTLAPPRPLQHADVASTAAVVFDGGCGAAMGVGVSIADLECGLPCPLEAISPERPLLTRPPPPEIDRSSLNVGRLLGSGASGCVHSCTYLDRPAALKLFHPGGASPDGRAGDEIAVACALSHPGLTRVMALVPGVTPGDPPGLIMALAPGAPLAGRPGGTLLRSTYSPGMAFDAAAVARGAARVAGALRHMHDRGACHGDVYAHNVIALGLESVVAGSAAAEAGTAPEMTLCDLGAAWFYDRPAAGAAVERLEVRAFGVMLGELVDRLAPGAGQGRERLARATERCLSSEPADRPLFWQLQRSLELIAASLDARVSARADAPDS